MNSDCGCDPVGSGNCGDNLKKWSVGNTRYVCDSDCGLQGGDCDTCAEMIVCYMFQMCRHESYHIDSFCIDGACRWTLAGFCESCEPRPDLPAQPQMICTQECL